MAVRLVTKEWTFTAPGNAPLTSILSRPANTWIASIAIRAARENTDDVFWKDNQGERGGFIGPGEAITIDFGAPQALVGNLTFLGTPDDEVFVTVGVNSDYFTSDDQ